MDSKSRNLSAYFRNPIMNNGLFTVLSLGGALLSYALYPVIAHQLSPSEFGDVSVVIALAGQIGGILLAFNVISIYVVNANSKSDAIRITEAIQKLLIQVLLGATILVMLFSPILMQTFKIGSFWTILGLGGIMLLTVPAVIWTGFLQGHNELARIGLYSFTGAGAKLLFAGVLSMAGLGATGAIFGIIIGQLLALWLLRYVPGTELPAAHGVLARINTQESKLIRGLASYIGESLVVAGTFSVLFAMDIMVAKAFFSQYQAGIYTGIASLGRIIFFGVSLLTWILLANTSPKDLPKSQRSFVRFLLLSVTGGGVVIAGFWLAAGPIIVFSLGSNYLVVKDSLWLVGVSQLLTSLLYGYTLYLLVLRRSSPALLALCVSTCAIGLGLTHPTDAAGLLWRLIAGQLIGYVAYLVLVSIRNLWKRTT